MAARPRGGREHHQAAPTGCRSGKERQLRSKDPRAKHEGEIGGPDAAKQVWNRDRIRVGYADHRTRIQESVSDLESAGLCHEPLCSFPLSHAFGALGGESGSALALHQGKRRVPPPLVPPLKPWFQRSMVVPGPSFSRRKTGICWNLCDERSDTVVPTWSEATSGLVPAPFPSPSLPWAHGSLHRGATRCSALLRTSLWEALAVPGERPSVEPQVFSSRAAAHGRCAARAPRELPK